MTIDAVASTSIAAKRSTMPTTIVINPIVTTRRGEADALVQG